MIAFDGHGFAALPVAAVDQHHPVADLEGRQFRVKLLKGGMVVFDHKPEPSQKFFSQKLVAAIGHSNVEHRLFHERGRFELIEMVFFRSCQVLTAFGRRVGKKPDQAQFECLVEKGFQSLIGRFEVREEP